MREAREYAREAVLKVADAVSGGEVVPIDTAHVSGVSYLTIGDHGVEFLKRLASLGARVSVFTTANPAAVDTGGVLEVDRRTAEAQREIIAALRALGVSVILSCAPYEFVLVRPRTAHAWAESSAAAYINTFKDAWTDKVPGPLALLSAIAGFAPRTQLYTPEGRRPTALVRVTFKPRDPLEAGIVGALIGERLGHGVPYVSGIRLPDEASRREFAAALSTYSSIVFAVIEGATPNWAEYARAADPGERIEIEGSDVQRLLRCAGVPDAVYVGCPLADAETVLWVINEVARRGPARRPVYVSTSPATYKLVERQARAALRLNVVILAGSCLVVSPHARRLKSIATDSAKAAFYISRLHGIRVSLCRREDCIKLAYA